MKLKVNGTEKEIPASAELNIQEFLNSTTYANLRDPFFAIAVNMEFVPKSAYGEFLLREGDQIEIVSPTAGG